MDAMGLPRANPLEYKANTSLIEKGEIVQGRTPWQPFILGDTWKKN
jgi:hypothetical protein